MDKKLFSNFCLITILLVSILNVSGTSLRAEDATVGPFIGVTSAKDCPSLSCPPDLVSGALKNPDDPFCSSYCVCVWGRSYWLNCPNSDQNIGSGEWLLFNAEIQKCDYPQNVKYC